MRNGQLLTYKDNDKKDGVTVVQNIVELNLGWRDLKASPYWSSVTIKLRG